MTIKEILYTTIHVAQVRWKDAKNKVKVRIYTFPCKWDWTTPEHITLKPLMSSGYINWFSDSNYKNWLTCLLYVCSIIRYLSTLNVILKLLCQLSNVLLNTVASECHTASKRTVSEPPRVMDRTKRRRAGVSLFSIRPSYSPSHSSGSPGFYATSNPSSNYSRKGVEWSWLRKTRASPEVTATSSEGRGKISDIKEGIKTVERERERREEIDARSLAAMTAKCQLCLCQLTWRIILTCW